MNKIIFLISIMLLVSCGGLKQVNTNDSSKSVKLIWDFSGDKNYAYSLTKTTTSKFNTSKNGPLLKSIITGSGNIDVHVKLRNLADFNLTNLKLNYKWFKEDGTLKDFDSVTVPTTSAKNIKPNGHFGESDPNLFFKLLMPLPSSSLQLGGYYKIPMKFFFEYDDPTLFVEGFNTITFTEVKLIQGRKYAILNGILDISNLNKPKELEGDFRLKITGYTTYYFDIMEGHYAGTDIHIVEHQLIDIQSTGTKAPEVYLKMESHDVFKIRLQGMADILK